jgi:hypothetical protein
MQNKISRDFFVIFTIMIIKKFDNKIRSLLIMKILNPYI